MPVDVTYCKRMAAYNTWMTEKAYYAADQMSDADRKEDRGAFFKSVHSTLNHILFGDRAWMSHFTGKAYEMAPIGTDFFTRYDELKAAHNDMCAEIEAFTEGLTPDWLSGTFAWINRSQGTFMERPRWLLIVHMFNHQTHHRGQLSTLFMQAGIDIGETDLPFMPDLETTGV